MSFICCVDPAHLQKFAINLLANFLGGLKNLTYVRIEVDESNIPATDFG